MNLIVNIGAPLAAAALLFAGFLLHQRRLVNRDPRWALLRKEPKSRRQADQLGLAVQVERHQAMREDVVAEAERAADLANGLRGGGHD